MQNRDYQTNILTKTRSSLKNHKHIIVCGPTGSGKTFIFSSLAKLSNDKNKRVLILTDRVELLSQAGGALKQLGLRPFFIQAGCKVVSDNYLCYVAMSQTLKSNRVGKSEYWNNFIKSIDLVIIDECHKQEFNYLFTSGLIDNIYTFGFTATPRRAGKMRQLGLDYREIINEITVKELIELGFLVMMIIIHAPKLTAMDFKLIG